MMSRLLLFEGPPGGGKSSLSQFVAQQLQAANIPAYWLEEHTLNSELFAAFFDALNTKPEEAVTALLAGWRQVVERLQTTSDVCCFDGAFFHSTLKLLLAYDYDQARVAFYLAELYDLLAPFSPALILLTGDVAHIMRLTIAERGAPWATHVADGVAQYPCQQRLGRGSVDDMIAFFIESQRQLDAIAATCPFVHKRIATTARDWQQYQHAVCEWLNIPIRAVARPLLGDFAQYVGTYQPPGYFPPAFNHPFQVEQTPDGLRLHMVFMRNFRLLAQDADHFAIAGRPLQLEFVRDAQGNLSGAIYPFVPDQRFFCEKIAQPVQRANF